MSVQFQHASARFGDFELNMQSGELYNGDIRVRLPRQSFQILAILLDRPGQVVTREELRRSLWPADTFVDFEHSVNSAVKRMREALNDTAENPRFIETLPRLGYRYIGPAVVRLQPVVPSPETAGPALPRESPAAANTLPDRVQKASSPRRWLTPVAVTLAVIASLAAYILWPRSRAHPRASAGRVMLAVLPFDNFTGDPGQEYFSDGLTEELIDQLGRLDPQHLRVIARTSVMHYKQGEQSLPQIARELGVQYIVEGSVRRDSQSVRISAQLIQMKDQTHVWSRQYDRQLSGLLALQGEVAQEIADEIQNALANPPKRNAPDRNLPLSPSSYEAYDLYLKGRYFWNKRSKEGFQQAAEFFQQAITKDPNYARAYAGLADTFGLMSTWYLVPQNEFMPKARAAALRALEIDGDLAEAHTSLALVAEFYDYDWQTAEREFKAAIQLDPSYATAHQWYAECLAWQGRFEEALAESERARQLDPLSVIITNDQGEIFYFSRQYDRAMELFRAVGQMDPEFPKGTDLLQVYLLKGQFAEALAQMRKPRTRDEALWNLALSAYVSGRSGQQVQARRALARLKRLLPDSQPDRTPLLLLAYDGAGRKDAVIALLQKAYTDHSSALVGLKVDPKYDPLRSDPRFQDLLRRVHLAQ